ncbi:DUF1311 domain-containing protein [Rhodobacteraceae bacterium B1Z28]|uniref:DUF1311 domain-containing protein n=1 Tax=Ruegeria haliotis TaxID=2747601 RepID=A0ABX2PPD0_9RHOB|nr:lysozyme inhibitor LprI family protein [Ruegeria haliotis]NVO55604.1 DUF1311 domain-containing protein [Ruegeria haliotis]
MRAFTTFLAALIPASSAAQSSCGGQTQVDANFCAKEQWEIADRELNLLWKEIKPLADARGNGQTLLEEQRTWLKRRDATCDQELASGGSAAAMFYWTCMEEQTQQRNQALGAWR